MKHNKIIGFTEIEQDEDKAIEFFNICFDYIVKILNGLQYYYGSKEKRISSLKVLYPN